MGANKVASQVRKSAEATFADGLYCAESVVLAMAKAQGIQSNLLPRVATAFCAGMARTGGTCGAVTGGLMGIGLALGRSNAKGKAQPSYDAAQKFIRQFEQEFGSRDCHKLLGCDLGTEEGQAVFREKKLIRQCAVYTGRAAEMAAQIVDESR